MRKLTIGARRLGSWSTLPATGAFDGAVLGALANSGGWFLGGALWPLGGAVLGAVVGGLLTARGVVRPERARWYLMRFAWVRVAVAAYWLNVVTSVDMLNVLGGVTVAIAVTVGYFIEANAFVNLAPRRFRAFAAVAGGLAGAVLGAVANSGGWFLGGALWPAGGAVVGALLGALVWGSHPPPLARRARIPDRAAPLIFLAPALSFVGIALVIPTLRTIYLSFWDRRSEQAIGFENYRSIWDDKGIVNFDGLGSWRSLFLDGSFVTSRLFIAGAAVALAALAFVIFRSLTTRRQVDLSAPLPTLSLTASAALVLLAALGTFSGVLWNNFFWITFVAGFATIIGLAIAVLADRARGESFAKSLIFMPMAISFVGAAIIWRFVYAHNPGDTQVGLLNAAWVNYGGEPQLWIQDRPWNTMFLIIVMIWIQTGFAMVILSAAIKGVPEEIREAARVDGATEMQTFWRVTLPHIRATMVVVVTTLIVTVLKIYDIVQAMTGGRFGTNVIANQMFDEVFQFRDLGRGSALAVLLFGAVIPLMILNVRRVRRQEEVR